MNFNRLVGFLRVHEVALRCAAVVLVLLFGMVQEVGAEATGSASAEREWIQATDCVAFDQPADINT